MSEIQIDASYVLGCSLYYIFISLAQIYRLGWILLPPTSCEKATSSQNIETLS